MLLSDFHQVLRDFQLTLQKHKLHRFFHHKNCVCCKQKKGNGNNKEDVASHRLHDVSMQKRIDRPLRSTSRALKASKLPKDAFRHGNGFIIGVEMIIKYSCRHNDDRNQY